MFACCACEPWSPAKTCVPSDRLPVNAMARTSSIGLQVSNTALLQSYYYQAYATVRKYSNCFVALCPPESQPDGSTFQQFMTNSSYSKVIQDVKMCAEATATRACPFDERPSSRRGSCVQAERVRAQGVDTGATQRKHRHHQSSCAPLH